MFVVCLEFNREKCRIKFLKRAFASWFSTWHALSRIFFLHHVDLITKHMLMMPNATAIYPSTIADWRLPLLCSSRFFRWCSWWGCDHGSHKGHAGSHETRSPTTGRAIGADQVVILRPFDHKSNHHQIMMKLCLSLALTFVAVNPAQAQCTTEFCPKWDQNAR